MKNKKFLIVVATIFTLLCAGATAASATSLNDSSQLMGYGIGYWLIGFAVLFGAIALLTMRITGHKAHPGKVSIPFIIIAAILLIFGVISFSSNTAIVNTASVNTPNVAWQITASATGNCTTIDPVNHIITIQCSVNSTSGTMKVRGYKALAFVAPTISFVCQPTIPNGASSTTTSATLTATATDPGNCITSTTDGTQYALILKDAVTQQAKINWTTGVGATLSTQRLTKQVTVLQGATGTLNLTEQFNPTGVSKLPAGSSKTIPISFQFGSGEENWVLQLFVTSVYT